MELDYVIGHNFDVERMRVAVYGVQLVRTIENVWGKRALGTVRHVGKLGVCIY